MSPALEAAFRLATSLPCRTHHAPAPKADYERGFYALPTSMIREIQKRAKAGESQRHISLQMGLSHVTVRKYSKSTKRK